MLMYEFTDEKPDVSYADIGGMDMQKQEMREAVELPLTHFELYKQIGIDPPRGVLMYGPPGTLLHCFFYETWNSTLINDFQAVAKLCLQRL